MMHVLSTSGLEMLGRLAGSPVVLGFSHARRTPAGRRQED